MTTRLPFWCVAAVAVALGGALSAEQGGSAPPRDASGDVRLMTLDPGHFHAALIQKEMYPGVAPRVDVYAPLGWDSSSISTASPRSTAAPIGRRRGTSRSTRAPTTSSGCSRSARATSSCCRAGTRVKMDRILASVKAGLNVLADKPWILKSADLPKLDAALAEADAKKIVAYDIMTERFEVTTMLQRALVNDRATFGEIVPGTEAEPAVYMESVHHLMKVVAGAPNIRPTWFFDTNEQGEAASDIGTHLVDLVQWTLFPDRAIDYKCRRQDAGGAALADVDSRGRLPPRHQHARVSRRSWRRTSRTAGSSTTATRSCRDALKGIHTKLNIIWDWEAPAGGGDTHFAFYRGTRAQGRDSSDKGRSLPARSLCRSGQCRGEGRSAGGGSGEDQERRRRPIRALPSRIAEPRSRSLFPMRCASVTRRISLRWRRAS